MSAHPAIRRLNFEHGPHDRRRQPDRQALPPTAALVSAYIAGSEYRWKPSSCGHRRGRPGVLRGAVGAIATDQEDLADVACTYRGAEGLRDVADIDGLDPAV
ncbi:hypothetical protein HNP40_001459 [Mycobacteroides chelonae]|nr:hypothetical protein [Mycobacteroides chelonae]